ncbi:IS3 family transposase [Gluconacetobacter sacchari]|uniref:IS3 family transposase n=3 Tax=Gluconacetobacter sacchari TaxID=92759 RepID=A0A7W4IHC6_9PROT|nr:IS3 family transposase [Gluconacetobacter sacchari]
MSQSISPSCERRYGLAQVCRLWKISRATLYRQRVKAPDETSACGRRGPPGAADDAELVAKIRAIIEASPFMGEGYRKIWARLRFSGVRTAARRVLRLMRDNGLLAPHRPAARPSRSHDGTIVTNRVDEVWGTDMTQTVTTEEGKAYVFIAVDHCSGELVGTHVSSSANRWQALEPVRQGVSRHLGGIGKGSAQRLVLRHDHGSNYMAGDFQREITFLGITSSPAFVRQPEGNGVAERAIRTLKEQFLWVRHFATIEELRLALAAFAARHNASWLRARHGYKTPDQIRFDQKPLASRTLMDLKLAA